MPAGRVRAGLGAVLLTAAVTAGAEVVDRSAGGFTVKTTVQVAAPSDRTFKALLDVGSWWGSDHTYSGNARNMSIVPQPGGCFCCPTAAASSMVVS